VKEEMKKEIDLKYQELLMQFDELKVKNTSDLLSFSTLYDGKVESLKDQWTFLSQQLLLEREKQVQEEKKSSNHPLLLTSSNTSVVSEEFLQKVKDDLQLSYHDLSNKVKQLELLQKQYQVPFFILMLCLPPSYLRFHIFLSLLFCLFLSSLFLFSSFYL
jgi:hypothetical protein